MMGNVDCGDADVCGIAQGLAGRLSVGSDARLRLVRLSLALPPALPTLAASYFTAWLRLQRGGLAGRAIPGLIVSNVIKGRVLVQVRKWVLLRFFKVGGCARRSCSAYGRYGSPWRARQSAQALRGR